MISGYRRVPPATGRALQDIIVCPGCTYTLVLFVNVVQDGACSFDVVIGDQTPLSFAAASLPGGSFVQLTAPFTARLTDTAVLFRIESRCGASSPIYIDDVTLTLT